MQPQPLTTSQIEAVQIATQKHGIFHTASRMGITAHTLQRAISGAPLQARTFAKLVTGMLTIQSQPEAPTRNATQQVAPSLVDAVNTAVLADGLVATSVRLGVAVMTLQKILAGGTIRPTTEARIVEGLKRGAHTLQQKGLCPVCGEPSEPHSTKPECQLCRLLDETLPVYLRSREARARVRRHLAEAQRKKAA